MPSSGLDFPEIAVVYARFTALVRLSPDVGGWLLLYAGLDRDGIALAMASNVAGTASLGIEPESARGKLALRAGVCDFLVNNLDEALRILKNEVRKRRAVSVVLTGDVDTVAAAMVARGVQPDVVAFPVRELIDRGARMLPADAEDALVPVEWEVASEPLRWLPVLDQMAVNSLGKLDGRRRWVEGSPRYLGRAFVGQRFLRMTEAEARAFISAVRAATTTGLIGTAVSITRGGERVSILV